jgi:hypothetical protein
VEEKPSNSTRYASQLIARYPKNGGDAVYSLSITHILAWSATACWAVLPISRSKGCHGRHFIVFGGAEHMESWIDQELAGCVFADERLGRRFHILMEQLSKGLGQTLPLACGDWASTKAAYRFLDNDRVSEQEILAGHFQATQARFASMDCPILVLHDTTEFSFTRSNTQAIGQTRKTPVGPQRIDGRWRMHTVCGILMHSSLAVTTDGVPLGLTAIKLWTRKKFKGTNALKGRGIDGGRAAIRGESRRRGSLRAYR